MRISYETDDKGEMPAGLCFEEVELERVEIKCKSRKATHKSRNLYKKYSRRHTTWIIARLGEWKGCAFK